jgi:hypothetical protein
VICEVDQVLGYVAICRNADHLFVDTVAVLPSHHGQGLGSQLLAFAEREASRLKLPSVRLFAMDGTRDNLAFYHRRGYFETDRRVDDRASLVSLCKAISSPPVTGGKLVPRRAASQPNLQVIAESDRQPVAADAIPPGQRRTINTIERSNCRWPIGDPQQKDFHFCGARTESENSYCARHRAIAYAPVRKSSRKALAPFF